MAALALALLLLAASAEACLLPPHGCFKSVCSSLTTMVIPPTSGQFSKVATWQKDPYNKLAFVRSTFNKVYGNLGPNSFTSASWLAMLGGLNGVAGGPPTLPSLNYEYYSLTGSTYTSAPATVTYSPEGATFNGSADVASCCNACRVTEHCAMYAFVPPATAATGKLTSVAGGSCYFIQSGTVDKDGPFDFTDGTSGYSPRTNNLKSLAVLNSTQTKTKLSTPSSFPDYQAMFLGGYCNPWKYPNGTITDDPHFTGAHGTRFDFNGELNKAFCLLTDRKLALNAVLKGYKSDNTFGATEGKDGKAVRSWIKELGLVWTDSHGEEHTLHLVARAGKQQSRGTGFLASAAFDGSSITIPAGTGDSFKAADLTFSFVNTLKKGWYELDKFHVVIGDRLDLVFNMRVAHPKLQTPEDAEVHFNLMVNDVKVTDSVHGVLGQTYRNTPNQVMKAVKYSELNKLMGGPIKADGQSGAGFLEGSVADYEASHVLKADCKVSSYNV